MVFGAKKIVEIFESKREFSVAFGIPGGPLSGIFHALSNSTKIKTVLTQHETSAAYLAIGYRLFGPTDTIPIVFATSGPGLTNLITGVSAAYEECVPLFVVTANVSTAAMDRRSAQSSFENGINGLKMMEPIVSQNAVLWNIQDCDRTVDELIEQAQKKGRPVHLNIPSNVAHQMISNRSEIEHANL